MGEPVIKQFVAALKKEEELWFSWNGVTPIPYREAEAIFKDPQRRKRILRLSEFLLLSVYASGCNGMFDNLKHTFRLWSGDVRTAFLQGEQNQDERDGDGTSKR